MIDKNQYPEGKLNDDDQGAMMMRVGEEKGNVVMDFGLPVVWFAMSPDDAMELAMRIMATAKKIGLKKPVTIDVRE